VKKVLFAAATLFVAAIVSTGAQSPVQVPAKSVTPDTPIAYQGMVSKYCIGCHNTRNPLPAGAPLAIKPISPIPAPTPPPGNGW